MTKLTTEQAEKLLAILTKGDAKVAEEKKVVVGEVIRQGTAVVVPPDMPLENAVSVLQQRMEYENTVVRRLAEFHAHPFDVAYAFGKAIREVCGTALGKSIESWFSSNPPMEISVEVVPGEFTSVMWGAIVFPFDPDAGEFSVMNKTVESGEVIGVCGGEFRSKYQHVWDKLMNRTRWFLEHESLFRGRTLRVKFGREVPEIKAWDVRSVDVSHLTFSAELEQHIEDHIVTPIRLMAECRQAGIPFKRGVLLTGPYGTGKTLLAASVARIAAEHGITVLYIEDVKELPKAIRMASRLAPAIVFAEDIDRVTDGQRDGEVDTILNTLDGIDTKNYPVMTILTSNYPDKIYKGMVRPGRIDVALHILPPDSEAAQRLVKTYLGSMFDAKNGDLEEMGHALAGMIPAVIREICERSKLSAISRTKSVPTAGGINADDVLRAARGMKNQIELLNAKTPEPTLVDKLTKISENFVKAVEVLEDSDVREFVENN